MTQPEKYPYVWRYRSDGEIFNEEFSSRDEAVDFAKLNGGGYIAECQSQNYFTRINGDRICEILGEINDDEGMAGDDGCEAFVVNRDLRYDLESMVHEAILAWVKKHKLNIKAWLFANIRNQELIQVEEPQP